jgi:hypothetical protein
MTPDSNRDKGLTVLPHVMWHTEGNWPTKRPSTDMLQYCRGFRVKVARVGMQLQVDPQMHRQNPVHDESNGKHKIPKKKTTNSMV